MSLNRDQILGFSLRLDTLASESVPVPEWDGDVSVRVMTGTERGVFEEANKTAPKESIRARLCAATLCEPTGELLFTAADVEWLGKLSCVALDRVFEVALRLNGIGPKSVEDEAKNS
jgi:hypothetical protein